MVGLHGEDNARYEGRLEGLINDILDSPDLNDSQRSHFYGLIIFLFSSSQ
jgi:hypothetical protein